MGLSFKINFSCITMNQDASHKPSSWTASAPRLMTTQVLAGFSQWIDIFLIFSVPAFLWQSTPGQIAIIASCFGLPGLFLGPFIGAILDRLDARRVAFIGALIRTALTGCIAFAGEFEFFSALVMLKGMANVFYWPATSILTQQLIGPTERINYFSSLSALDQITKIMTPLIAGAATLFIELRLVFLISAIMTLASAAIIFLLPKSNLQHHGKEFSESVLQVFLAGQKLIKTLPSDLLLSIILGIGISFSLAIYDPHVAAYLNSLKFDPKTFSLLVSSTATGAACGALCIRFFGKKFPPIRFIQTGIAIFFIAISSIATIAGYFSETTNVAALLILWFITGIGYEVFLIGSSVTMQNLCPPHLLGRVVTSARSLQMLAVVTGPLIGAWLISARSRATPFGVSALVVCLLLMASLRSFPRLTPTSR